MVFDDDLDDECECCGKVGGHEADCPYVGDDLEDDALLADDDDLK